MSEPGTHLDIPETHLFPAPTPSDTPPSSGKSSPHRSRQRKARKYALDLLYSADLKQCAIEEAIADYESMNDRPIPAYSLTIARGVADRDYLIDGYLAPSLAQGWTVERMPIVDRCLARIACYEMIFADVPVAVAIAEAVALAEELSTDSSPTFLTGVLGKVATLIPSDDDVPPQTPKGRSSLSGKVATFVSRDYEERDGLGREDLRDHGDENRQNHEDEVREGQWDSESSEYPGESLTNAETLSCTRRGAKVTLCEVQRSRSTQDLLTSLDAATSAQHDIVEAENQYFPGREDTGEDPDTTDQCPANQNVPEDTVIQPESTHDLRNSSEPEETER